MIRCVSANAVQATTGHMPLQLSRKVSSSLLCMQNGELYRTGEGLGGLKGWSTERDVIIGSHKALVQ